MKHISIILIALFSLNLHSASAQDASNDGGKVIIAVNTNWGVGYYTDDKGNFLFRHHFEKVYPFVDGLAEVYINGKATYIDTVGNLVDYCKSETTIVKGDSGYGIINSQGEYIVPCIYDSIDSFSEGLAQVRYKGAYGCIDTKGTIIIPPIYDCMFGFQNGIAQVKKNGLYGLINIKNELIIPVVYEYADVFNDYLYIVKVDGKYGLIDRNENIVLPCKYGLISASSDGNISQIYNEEGKYGFVNNMGEIVTPCVYDEDYATEGFYPAMGNFENGYACVIRECYFGFVNTEGVEVIPCIYNQAYGFSDGLAAVWVGGKCGFIDHTGAFVIPCIYEDAFPFSEGLACVCLNGKYGYIDTNGEVVIPFIYDYLAYYNGEEEYLGISEFHDGLTLVRQGKVYKVLNKEGDVVIPCCSFDTCWSKVE